jgi:type VI secretion system secreted protein Hcp
MPANIYLKIGKRDGTGKPATFFKGNSQDTNHPLEIELQSWGHSFEQPISAATKSSELGPTSRCIHNELSFSKFYDNATDDLVKACWVGTCLDAYITIYRTLDGSDILTQDGNLYLQIMLKNCYIKSMSFGGEAEEIPKEDITLVYNYIQYQFTEIDLKTGKLDTTKRPKIDWNWTVNEVVQA